MFAALAWSYAKPYVGQYKSESPLLRPEVFFNGTLHSWGMIQNLLGRSGRHFTALQTAQWNGKEGVMDETLSFGDGTVQKRQWHFTLTGDHHVIGTAADVPGRAEGEFYGNALHWKYDIEGDMDGNRRVVTFDDWLFLIDGKHMFSHISIRKFGIPVGKLTMFFEKE